MFVAQQAARSRVVRTTFVVACLLPCAALVAWAGWRRTGIHRDRLLRPWAGAVGMPLSVGRVEHLRPGSLRLHGVVVKDDLGARLVEIPWIEVEEAATEVRIRLPEFTGSPEAIAAIARLGRAWLDEPVRFDRNVVIDVGRVGFTAAAGSAAARSDGVGVRIECVGAGGGRAIRLRTEPESEEGLVVQALAGTDGGGRRTVVQGTVVTPLPIAAVAAALGWPAAGRTAGPAASLTGAIDAEIGAQGWEGSFRATLTDLDLAAVTASLPWRGHGSARLVIGECRMEGGRIASIRARVDCGAGGLAQEGLEALVTTLGCRPGPGWRPVARRGEVEVLEGSASLSIDRFGLRIERPTDAGLLVGHAGVLIEPPAGSVSLDRVARALSPASAIAVPATPMSGWLLSVFPYPGAGGAETERGIPIEPSRSPAGDFPPTAPVGPVGAGGPSPRR